MRIGKKERITKETQISLEINLDGAGIYKGTCGNGFFDHMLTLFSKHGSFDLDLRMTGDIEVDFHHSVEDLGLILGDAIKCALGDKRGIERYGHIILPMDEVLVLVALDLSNRSFLSFNETFNYDSVGDFPCELLEEFLRALTNSLGMNLHIKFLEKGNTHHMIEGAFKALARSLKKAVKYDGTNNIPSTKGII